MIPGATYRVQFHRDFPFSAAIPLASYLRRLGISHLYSSPIATARAGSNHGYDVVDPGVINPELGGEDGFRALAAALRDQGIGIILDIVPNHVAVGHGDNAWWLDVLEKGEASAFAKTFDIDWHPEDPALSGKLLAPFLGTPYAEALRSGDLQVKRVGSRLALAAYDTHVFPLRPEDQETLADADLSGFSNPDALHELCERQHWRLTWWRTAGDAINWRRFFDITELAGIRVEDEAVFNAVHALPLRLHAEGLIDGVRVDHIDGLADPASYCRRLRAALGDDAYIVVEKILASGESLPSDWPIDGTSGYDFLNDVSALLHDPAGAAPLAQLWHDVSGRPGDFAIEEHAARHELIQRAFAGQLDATTAGFLRLARSDISTRDLSGPALRRAIAWLIESFPAYRTYCTGTEAPPSDAPIRDQAAKRAIAEAGPAETGTVEQVVDWLAGKGPGDPALRRDAARRFQQLSAPIAAKAVEDTAFYRFGRLLSRNDVGCDPARLGASPEMFAEVIVARGAAHPHAMLATATHDHKRGEDMRARLAVLSEIPDIWGTHARRWGGSVPSEVDAGDGYMLHQTIVGAWPMALMPDDAGGLADFAERLAGWQQKALREAKLRSSWACPDAAYEEACAAYLHDLLQAGGDFARQAREFAMEIAPAGAAKSLVQTALRCTLPGMPDLFQGREGWDFSLVDPDNRRPVDYDALQAMFEAGGDWRSGATKQKLIADLLDLRRQHPALFANGTFEPLPLSGRRKDDALAFLRRLDGDAMLLVVCAVRCAEACIAARSPDPSGAWWADTKIALPAGKECLASQIGGGSAVGFQLL